MQKKSSKTSQNIIKYYCETNKKITPKPDKIKPRQVFQVLISGHIVLTD